MSSQLDSPPAAEDQSPHEQPAAALGKPASQAPKKATAALRFSEQPEEEYDYDSYRAVSSAAVFSLILGVISFAGLMSQMFLIFPLLGVIIGLFGIWSVRRNAEELTGEGLAKWGVGLSAVLLFAGAGYHTYDYLTEVPEGFERISFAQLQPSSKRPDLPVPPEALEMDGESVFIKGYIYPDGQQEGIKQFVLIPDLGTCCFGGQPKLTDMIQVTLRDPLRVKYSFRQVKLAGTLKVSDEKKPLSGLDGVYYELDAEYLR